MLILQFKDDKTFCVIITQNVAVQWYMYTVKNN